MKERIRSTVIVWPDERSGEKGRVTHHVAGVDGRTVATATESLDRYLELVADAERPADAILASLKR